MIAENAMVHANGLTFDEYLKVATDSVGIMFVWASYFVVRNISDQTLQAADSVLVLGAQVARLSNDIASHRKKKKEINAVTLLGSRQQAVDLMKQKQAEFHEKLAALALETGIKQVIKNSVDFLVSFYQVADFD